MPNTCEIPGKIVNHSLHKSTCQTLLSSGVEPVIVCQLNGHKDVNSLRNYTTADLAQQKEMSRTLSSKAANCTISVPPK